MINVMQDFTDDRMEIDPVDVQRRMAIHQLERWFPRLETHIHSLSDSLALHVLNRVMTRMLHLDAEFKMEQEFDDYIFDECLNEAKSYIEWLKTDDSNYPELIRYKSSYSTIDDYETVDHPVKKHHVRGIAPNSRYQRAMPIIKLGLELKHQRATIVDQLMAELELSEPTASCYYSKIKKELTLQMMNAPTETH